MYGSNSEWDSLNKSQQSNSSLSALSSIRSPPGVTKPSSNAGPTRPSSNAGLTRPSSNAGLTRPSSNAGLTRPSSNAGLTRPSNNVDVARMALSGLTNSNSRNVGLTRSSGNFSSSRPSSNNVEAAQKALSGLTNTKSNSHSDSSSRLAELSETVASMQLQLRRPSAQLLNSSRKRQGGMARSSASTPNFVKHEGPLRRRTSFSENFELSRPATKEESPDEDTPMKSIWSSSSLRNRTPNSSYVNMNQAEAGSPPGASHKGNADWDDLPVEKNIRSTDPVELIKSIQQQQAITRETSNNSLKNSLKSNLSNHNMIDAHKTNLTRSHMSGHNLSTQFDLKRSNLSGGQDACISKPSSNAGFVRHSNNVEAAQKALSGLTNTKSNSHSKSSSRMAELAETVTSMEPQLCRGSAPTLNPSLKRQGGMARCAVSSPNFRKHNGPISRTASFCKNFVLSLPSTKEETPYEDNNFVNVNQAKEGAALEASNQGNADWEDLPVEENNRSMNPVELIKTFQQQRTIKKDFEQ